MLAWNNANLTFLCYALVKAFGFVFVFHIHVALHQIYNDAERIKKKAIKYVKVGYVIYNYQ